LVKHGEQVGGAARLFVRDHLGSVSAVTDGAVNTLARYQYDPWGRRDLVVGTESTAVGFTGHWFHAPSELWLTQYRAYDADLGRWISEDPIKERGDGPNLSAYVLNEPLTRIDPLGLQHIVVGGGVRDDFPQCAVGAAAAVWFHHRRGDIDDRYAHCLASCLIAKTCGQAAAKAAESSKERLDVFLCYQVGRQGNCTSAEQDDDYLDNARGRDHAKCPGVDCRSACNDLKGKGPGEPGPHANANQK
jgi:RHS repeat-associated protein